MFEKRYYIGDKSRKVLKDTIRRVGAGNGSERPTGIRRRPMGSGRGSQAYQFGMLIADVPGCELFYEADPDRSRIDHGYAESAVIPIQKVVDAEGVDQLFAEGTGEDGEDFVQTILPAVNPCWPYEIKAGTGVETAAGPPPVYASKPVLVWGRTIQWSVPAPTPEGAEDLPEGTPVDTLVFFIENVFYPVSIIKGEAKGAVSGTSDFPIDNVVLLWGRDPRNDTADATEEIEVANPEGFDGDDNAYTLAMQITDGTWLCIDLACPGG